MENIKKFYNKQRTKFGSTVMNIYIADVTEMDKNFINQLYDDLPYYRKNKADKFRKSVDRNTCIVAYALLYESLITDFNLEKNDINILSSQFGKPYLNSFEGVYFNISHSNTLVTCVTSNFEIGVDIEYLDKVDLKIMDIVCDPMELMKVDSSQNKYIDFYKIWTKKEAIVKKRGTGLNDEIKKIQLDENERLLQHVDLNKNFVMSIII